MQSSAQGEKPSRDTLQLVRVRLGLADCVFEVAVVAHYDAQHAEPGGAARGPVGAGAVAALGRGPQHDRGARARRGQPDGRHAVRAGRRARRALSELLRGARPAAGVVRAGEGRARRGRGARRRPARAHRAPGLLGELYAIRFHAGARARRSRTRSASRSGCTSSPGAVRVGPVDAPVELGPGDYARYSGRRAARLRGAQRGLREPCLMLTGRACEMKRAARMDDVVGFGIDRVAAAVDHRRRLRLENLDTDLGLPPEAVAVTRAALEDPVSNSWLPFTGDLGLRAAISEHIAARHGRVYDPESRDRRHLRRDRGRARRPAGDARPRRRGRARPTRSTRGSSTACGWRAACRRSRRWRWSTASGGSTATLAAR